jgi:hypothetical protein
MSMTNFTCPNCGFVADDETSGGIVFTMVSTIFDEKDPWRGVLQRCGNYNRTTLAGAYGGSMGSCTRADGTMARAEIT